MRSCIEWQLGPRIMRIDTLENILMAIFAILNACLAEGMSTGDDSWLFKLANISKVLVAVLA